MTKQNKTTIQMIGSIVVLLLGVAIILISLLLPPKGVIDPSVNIAFGECLTFVGAIFGIDAKYKEKLQK